MSREFKMYAYNSTGEIITKYKIFHYYNSNNANGTLEGKNLAPKKRSDASKKVKSGTNNGINIRDDYRVEVTFADGSEHYTQFGCMSSSDHNCVEMAIHREYVNCHYYTQESPKDVKEDTGCHKKHWI